ncbi:cell-division ABC transporter (protein ftsX) [Bacillus velezensis UCMB5036]|uniref:Cell division protein FtsX n=6 Tax=Bacillus TaxID=1386 RepID=A0A7W4LV51_BACVE|nr:cell division protein FtsX [Bacillus velezensis]AMQ69248.1 cell division protein FtsX [Bacillus amyloliquefaciens UMAF6639]EIF14853.1 FtsX-like permease family protein [Bacillus sp. 5B6]ERH57240.1 cell division protein FtsX [Bacillus amyloliquefaciens EGD-AQ14]CCP23175.1 cell-division ABC transporter (protein ftsX) [Bacillus velezensis UCMB5036]CUB25774.1 Cell division protein FtsX [Bacillus amyloliquefaciens]
MVLMIKILGRHLRESFKSLGRNTWMTFASISAVTVTLILVGVFLVIMLNLNNMAKNAEKEVEIKVLIDLTSNKKTQDTLQNEIKDISGIQSVEFSSKDKELDQLVKSFGDSGKAMKMQDQENPLNNAFIVKTTDPHDTPKVAKKIEKLDHVYKVTYGKEEVSRLFKIVGVSRNIGIALIIGLLFTAMFLISNTIKITIFARRKEIEIMKLVGATNWFIRWPFFLEGLLLGVFGSIIPIALVLSTYQSMVAWVAPKVQGSFVSLLPYSPFVFQVSLVLILIGAVIGVWGSLTSIRKFLRV